MMKTLYQTSDTAIFSDISEAEKRENIISFANSLAKRIWLRNMSEDDLAFALKGFFQNQANELAFLFEASEE